VKGSVYRHWAALTLSNEGNGRSSAAAGAVPVSLRVRLSCLVFRPAKSMSGISLGLYYLSIIKGIGCVRQGGRYQFGVPLVSGDTTFGIT
jgi:hypothetical protein